jgi:hypothetical protein
MDFSFTLDGDIQEDKEQLLFLVHANDMRYALSEIDNIIRSRLKHGENVSEEEEENLERIREWVHIEGLADY